jgi:hypothetical protein
MSTTTPPATLSAPGGTAFAACHQHTTAPERPSSQSPPGTTSTEETAMATREATPTTITIVGWDDPAVDSDGFAADSGYTEACYLPRLGPTGFVTYRYLARLLADRDRAVVDLVEAAGILGLRPGVGRSAPLPAALAHLEAFGLAARRSDGGYDLRRRVPALTERQAARLPGPSRSFHNQAMQARRDAAHDHCDPIGTARPGDAVDAANERRE